MRLAIASRGPGEVEGNAGSCGEGWAVEGDAPVDLPDPLLAMPDLTYDSEMVRKSTIRQD
jgi:hypothetical protein